MRRAFFIPGAGEAAGPALMAATCGTEAYTETDSPAAGLIAAGTAGLMPAAGNITARHALQGNGCRVGGRRSSLKAVARLSMRCSPNLTRVRCRE